MSRATCLIALLLALAPSLSAGFSIRVVVGGKSFAAHLKPSQPYCGPFFITARQDIGRGRVAELFLTCGNVEPGDVLPETINCGAAPPGVTSRFSIKDAKSHAVRARWVADPGMLQATITSFTLHRPTFRWRIRGTFSGTLSPSDHVSTPLDITDGQFRASLEGVDCGND